MDENVVRYSLRLPSILKAHLEVKAKKNGRSLNNEIVAILESCSEPYEKGTQIQRIKTSGSTYTVRDQIRDFILSKPGITGALLAVRNGELNKSALTLIIYEGDKKTLFDTCSLTTERRPREWEVYELCNALDSQEALEKTRFVTERVPHTEGMEPSDAITALEDLPAQLVASKNVYRFLSLFCYTDNVSQIPPKIFIKDWRYLCGIQPEEIDEGR